MTTRRVKRPGPRPLPLHLAMAATVWLGAAGACGAVPPAWTDPQAASPPDAERARRLADALGGSDAFRRAVGRAAARRLATFLDGVEAYRRHPYRRALADPPVAWARGGTRLLDFAGDGDRRGAPVLFVPSLINRATVLDLARGRSLMRWLAAEGGMRPLLLDWGEPAETERDLGLDGFIADRLEPALAAVAEREGRPVVLAGYCMGGLLALAAAQRNPDRVAGLALLATPWDFHADGGAHARLLGALWPHLAPLFEASGAVPVDVLQCLFFAMDPLLVLRKFADFAGLDQQGEAARRFVALEDWINDGVALPARVARECFVGWYGDNLPGRDRWQVGGVPVRPSALAMPAFVACPQRDRIVPPASSATLARRIAGATVIEPALGHVGMIVGGRARQAVWQPFAQWLRTFERRTGNPG
ncbi:MAG: alpha/beta fold hydrolase [Alphaproteobacteria bacterium]